MQKATQAQSKIFVVFIATAKYLYKVRGFSLKNVCFCVYLSFVPAFCELAECLKSDWKMKFWKNSLLVCCLAVFALSSCKEDDTAEKGYVSGSVNIVFPEYVNPGYTKSFNVDTLMTLGRPDGGDIAYYYTDVKSGKRDTVAVGKDIRKQVFKITSPADSLGPMSFVFGGFCPDEVYYGRTKTVKFVAVSPGVNGNASLTNYPEAATEYVYVDERDNRRYHYTAIGNTYWMIQNLAYTGSGYSYKNSPAMDNVFGRLYTWDQAQTACPEGWRIASDEDWARLAARYGENATVGEDYTGLAGELMGDIYFNGDKMWEYWREVRITNESLLSIIPVGYGFVEDGNCSFEAYGKYAAFWTSDSVGEDGVCRYIFENKDLVYYGVMPKSEFAAAVRCVR